MASVHSYGLAFVAFGVEPAAHHVPFIIIATLSIYPDARLPMRGSSMKSPKGPLYSVSRQYMHPNPVNEVLILDVGTVVCDVGSTYLAVGLHSCNRLDRVLHNSLRSGRADDTLTIIDLAYSNGLQQ